jgi:hypothetical protein
MTKTQLIKELKKIQKDLQPHNIDKDYNAIYDLAMDYTDGGYSPLEEYFNDFVHEDTLHDILEHELAQWGWKRVKYMLADIIFEEDLYKINGYGNIENVSTDDLDTLIHDLINNLK